MVTSSTICWYIAPTIDSIPWTTTSESRVGSSLGGMSLASSPSISSRIGVTTRSTYHELAHSYGSPPAAVVSSAVAVTAARWSSMSRSSIAASATVERVEPGDLFVRLDERLLDGRRGAEVDDVVRLDGRQGSRRRGVADPAGFLLLGGVFTACGDQRAESDGQPTGLQQLPAVERVGSPSLSLRARPAASGSASLTNRASRSSPSPAASASTVQWRASTTSIEATRLAASMLCSDRSCSVWVATSARLEVVGRGRQRRHVRLLERGDELVVQRLVAPVDGARPEDRPQDVGVGAVVVAQDRDQWILGAGVDRHLVQIARGQLDRHGELEQHEVRRRRPVEDPLRRSGRGRAAPAPSRRPRRVPSTASGWVRTGPPSLGVWLRSAARGTLRSDHTSSADSSGYQARRATRRLATTPRGRVTSPARRPAPASTSDQRRRRRPTRRRPARRGTRHRASSPRPPATPRPASGGVGERLDERRVGAHPAVDAQRGDRQPGVGLGRIDHVGAAVGDAFEHGAHDVGAGRTPGEPDQRAAGAVVPVRRAEAEQRRHVQHAVAVVAPSDATSWLSALVAIRPRSSRSHSTFVPADSMIASTPHVSDPPRDQATIGYVPCSLALRRRRRFRPAADVEHPTGAERDLGHAPARRSPGRRATPAGRRRGRRSAGCRGGRSPRRRRRTSRPAAAADRPARRAGRARARSTRARRGRASR